MEQYYLSSKAFEGWDLISEGPTMEVQVNISLINPKYIFQNQKVKHPVISHYPLVL